MKTNTLNGCFVKRYRAAFTLIELLVVISIIAVLAGLILGIGGVVGQKKTIARAQAQMHKLEMAIETYKSKMGFYPPSSVYSLADRTNPTITVNRAARNPLFYELTGTVLSETGSYVNIFGDMLTSAQVNSYFNMMGFANAANSRDEAQNFCPTVSSDELGNINTGSNPLASPVWVFVLPADGPLAFQSQERGGKQRWVVPWCYDASSTNRMNAESYDLWIDIVLGGKTNRICNWSDSPLIL
jgi:prepilin-type N-terminal cleavage/methylation domain-containing protein